jgi:glycosyltransferase involved in cell wall biosynthesis
VRIGIVTQWYPPEPAVIPAGLAEELAARGHRVRVLTGFPNYPGGRIYPGYRQRWRHRESAPGVTVRRVPLYPSHDASAVRRAANYLSFAATSTVAAVGYLAGADVLYVYHPPATAFAAPALLRLLDRVPVVLHVQDIWPESVTASPMAPRGPLGALTHRTLGSLMRRMYTSAAGIAVISPSMRDLIVEQGADPSKVSVVLNWTDESLFRPVAPTAAARQIIGHRGRCTVMHAGNVGPFQNIADAIRAAAAVDESGQVDLVLVGSGLEEESARALAARLGAGNVRFVARRPLSEMAALYGAAEYQLISLRNLAVLRGSIPSKLPAALRCGSPVVVAAAGDSAALVDDCGAGLSCPPENWRALADRYRQAAALPPQRRAEMGRRALHGYWSRMSRTAGVDRLERMLVAAARSGPAR